VTDEIDTVDPLATEGARVIHRAYGGLEFEFKAITRRARARFEDCNWQGHEEDAAERLDLYRRVIAGIVSRIRDLLGDRLGDVELWKRIKPAYSDQVGAERNREVAETFFNSVTRRIFSTVGVNPDVEFVLEHSPVQPREPDPSVYRVFESNGDTGSLIRDVLEAYRFEVDYEDLDRDAKLVAAEIDTHLESLLESKQIDAIETLKSVFYRNKGAYVVGRIRTGNRILPFVLPLMNDGGGVFVDTVMLIEEEVSILFSFTRAYFHVEAERPRELIIFLKTIMPLKPIAELYVSLGLNRHGKTELYRSLRGYLDRTPDRFHLAEGDRGMVMIVFTLPLYDVVFKVIRDDFDFPKTHSRREVMERYRLVFKHDRVGRLVDAQEFEHLKFRKERFNDDLLEELLRDAARTVSLDGDHVVISHLYTERKVTPLNLYLRKGGREAAIRAVVDYGNANKELAAANIFPGDFLLKNYGVTRHGRVVFYDYDELCLITDCNFRRLPVARHDEDELESETWFAVGENDIFPEEFVRFLELDGELRDAFYEHHLDLFTVEFWQGVQDRLRAGEIMDVFPYPQSRRFNRPGPS